MTKWEQPDANKNIADGKAQEFDVMVLYDLWEPINEKEKEGYLSYLKSGKGIVSLHHSLGNYQTWDEFVKIIGGSYVMNEKPRTIDGTTYPPSNYIHDMDVTVNIADANHPVTKGIKDFEMVDEVYGDLLVLDDVHVLLRTSHPKSNPVIGWTNRYGNANIVCLQSGHGPTAFQNPNYIKLVRQAIRWVAASK
jgi:type 1 glutamine amidotransferase